MPVAPRGNDALCRLHHGKPIAVNNPMDSTWQDFRRQMPIAERWAYFDHAAVSPIPRPAQQAIARWATQAAEAGDTVWLQWQKRVEECRARAARMLVADPAEVALVHSTSEGISLVAEGYPWREGDNVVTLENEFPANQYPWMNLASRGVETRRLPVGDRGRVDLTDSVDASNN